MTAARQGTVRSTIGKPQGHGLLFPSTGRAVRCREFVRLCASYRRCPESGTPEGKFHRRMGAEQGDPRTIPCTGSACTMSESSPRDQVLGCWTCPDGLPYSPLRVASEAILPVNVCRAGTIPRRYRCHPLRVVSSETADARSIVCEDERIQGCGRIAGHHQERVSAERYLDVCARWCVENRGW